MTVLVSYLVERITDLVKITLTFPDQASRLPFSRLCRRQLRPFRLSPRQGQVVLVTPTMVADRT